MNSDIVFVHSDITKDFTTELLKKLQSYKMTTNTDNELGLTPLTMTKSFDKLLVYKEKYKKYLVNPEARINTETKQVEPHVFVIPFSEFKDLDIQEHFAPFVTIVKFDKFDQLESASLDTRLQKKAMAALIYGAERMSPDMERARNIFRQAQHFVLINTHLYQEFEMNMPFGGIGTDTSISTLIKLGTNGDVTVENKNRPLLLSKETDSVFATDGSYRTDSENNRKQLPETYYPVAQRMEDASQKTLLDAGQKSGVTVLLTRPLPEYYLQEAKKLYGVNLVYQDALGAQPKKIPGVVLHTVEVTKAPSNKTSLIGDRNPLLGEESVLKIIQQNKMEELKLAQSVDPQVMPGVKVYEDFFNSEQVNHFKNERERIIDLLNKVSAPVTDVEKQKLESSIYSFVSHFLTTIQRQAPRGAYVKNYGEYASGDLGSTITSFSASPKQITKEFLLWFYQSQNKLKNKSFSESTVQDFLNNQAFSNFTRFVRQLLIDPSQLLVQKRIELAQTQQGATMEFRVDFFNGRAVSSRMRFGLEHYPEEMQKAKEVVNNFFEKAK